MVCGVRAQVAARVVEPGSEGRTDLRVPAVSRERMAGVIPAEFPETEAELYDLLQEMFGIGTYDEAVGSQAWHRARMVEVMKIKGLCRRRRASVKQVAIAAWYAKQNRLPIRHSVRLFALIPEAMRAYNAELRATEREAQERELNQAIVTAMRTGRQDWADRMMRASGKDVRGVLDEWEATAQ